MNRAEDHTDPDTSHSTTIFPRRGGFLDLHVAQPIRIRRNDRGRGRVRCAVVRFRENPSAAVRHVEIERVGQRRTVGGGDLKGGRLGIRVVGYSHSVLQGEHGFPRRYRCIAPRICPVVLARGRVAEPYFRGVLETSVVGFGDAITKCIIGIFHPSASWICPCGQLSQVVVFIEPLTFIGISGVTSLLIGRGH